MENPAMLSYSAALLVGGVSRRMGRDKATLPVPGTDLLLWQRQWQLLEELEPDEIFWSGPPRPHMPGRARWVTDLVENSGPLGGLAACLAGLESQFLVLLAVDLPQMNAAFLRNLLANCSAGCGAVAWHHSFYEPLAAVYPKRLQSIAAEHLARGRFAMQDFIREAIKMQALKATPLAAQDGALFKNLNTPDDLPSVHSAFSSP